MKKVSDVLRNISQKYGLKKNFDAAMVLKRMEDIITEKIPEAKNMVKGHRFSENIMWLSVSNSVVAQVIQEQKKELLKEINDFPEFKVTDIKTLQKSTDKTWQ